MYESYKIPIHINNTNLLPLIIDHEDERFQFVMNKNLCTKIQWNPALRTPV